MRSLALLLLGLVPALATAQSVPIYGKSGMAVSVEENASRVGVEIMKAGGNAYDAAAAMGFALAVTYPQAGNIGGGGFALMLDKSGARYTLDFRETAPLAATRDMFLDAQGNVAAGRSTDTHLAVGVPGTVDGLLRMQERFGKLSREAVMAPAITLASDGFAVSRSLHTSLRNVQRRLSEFAATRNAFYAGGAPPEFGSHLKQPDLAKTLNCISTQGRAGFYAGETARLIESEMRKHGGLIAAEDLRRYESKWREPFAFKVGDREILTHPLPSSGSVTLAQIFGLINLDKLQEAGFGSAAYVHHIVEAERLAYADRNHFLGDPDFVQVPVAKLTSAEYLAERRKLIPTDRAGKSSEIGHGNPEKEETTHYCVADAEGNVVAVTYTLNGSFGMGAVVEGAGFLLNNEMDDFTSKPGVPNLYGLVQSDKNAIQPGKRMLSSMTPTIVLNQGKFEMTVGSPGGSTIITTVLQCVLNRMLFDMNIRDAIDSPRFHHQHLPDEIALESRSLSPDTEALLTAMGYTLAHRGSIGIAAGIQRMPDGTYAGWADKRGDGRALGY